MKKIGLLIVLAIVGCIGAIGWAFFADATSVSDKHQYVMIQEDETSIDKAINKLASTNLIKSRIPFWVAAKILGSDKKVVAGKYEIKKGQTANNILKMMIAGRFAEVKLIINKLRIREDFAKLVSKTFPIDSAEVMNYINNNDSLSKFGVDSNNFNALIIPNTYAFYWNASLPKILQKLSDEKDSFWQKEDRLNKAKAIGFTPEQIITLASIVEEESNYNDDRPNVASVYINRLNKGMPLQADPTIKYALKDFTLKRIYEKYLFTPSPFNTYRNKGLPPGPICTPSIKCIDIVLTAPKTDYIYFVANANFDGRHHYSNNYAEHMQYAKHYQLALDEYLKKKQN